MNRYEIDRYMNDALNESSRNRIDVGYQMTGKLYYAFCKRVDSNTASDMLYTTAGMLLHFSGEYSISYAVYDFLASCFGVNLSHDAFVDALKRHSSQREIDIWERSVSSFNNDEASAFIVFAVLLYTSDGRITQAEKEYIYNVLGQ